VKAILDTNVLISGIFFSGIPYDLLAAWRDRKIELVITPEILAEYRRVGASPPRLCESGSFWDWNLKLSANGFSCKTFYFSMPGDGLDFPVNRIFPNRVRGSFPC
jgi:hypothetical protein